MSSSTELKQWREQNLLHKLIYDWILVPFGIIVILCIVIAVNQVFRAMNFNFPANVASMLMMSILLIIAENTLKASTMNKILKWINPAIDFIMNWMIIFFFPPILTIIISTNLPSGVDIVKLIIVFFLGLIIFIPLVGYFIHYASIFFEKFKKSIFKSKLNDNGGENDEELKVIKDKKEKDNSNVIEIVSNDDEKTEAMDINYNNNNNNNNGCNPQLIEDCDVTEVEATLPTQEEIININDDDSNDNDNNNDNNDNNDNNNNNNNNNNDTQSKKMNKITENNKNNTNINSKIYDPKTCTSTTKPSCEKTHKQTKFQWKSSVLPSKYCFATYIIIYLVSFIPAALWDFPQPLHIAATVLSFFICLSVPDRLRVFFHPLICCAFVCYALFWIQALIFGRGIKDEIRLYSNNSKYLLYLNDTSLPFPKATEILFCLLDATVVAFSFKILEHHKLIIRHIFELVGSIIIMSLTSMTVHTALCRLLGVAPLYSLSMASRSSTNPLAVQVVNYLHSDMAVAIVLVAFTGVFTDILGLPLLKLVRFPLEDALAHGACMGCAGHAMATAGLVKNFPSASAVSSISFVLFSTCCVIWSAIPFVGNLIRSIAGI